MKNIEAYWKENNFEPNEDQKKAILNSDGPLFITAGPGSGKTRVLLWKTFNLIVFHAIKPDEIYLGTFTEKAAKQLKEGIRFYLSLASMETGQHYDIANMYVGTIHSNCHRLLSDRRLIEDGMRPEKIDILDELDQYLFLNRNWNKLLDTLHYPPKEFQEEVCKYFYDTKYKQFGNKYDTITACISIFNRYSEEMISDEQILDVVAKGIIPDAAKKISLLYIQYKKILLEDEVKKVDLSLLQGVALEHIRKYPRLPERFKYIIVDEYQDTNKVQERIFFELAKYSKNICVVGDDDQSLYRFRGASVQNIVNFKERAKRELGVKKVNQENLKTNYRSRAEIVNLYKEFVSECNWKRNDGGYYRVHDKEITASSQDTGLAIIKTDPVKRDKAAKQIAEFVHFLVDKKFVDNENKIAFLYSRFKSNPIVKKQKRALEKVGINVYAPRAGRFFDQEEPRVLINLFLEIFGRPTTLDKNFNKFLHNPKTDKEILKQVKSDQKIKDIIATKQFEIETVINDYEILHKICKKENINVKDTYDSALHESKLLDNSLSKNAVNVIKQFSNQKNPTYKDKTVQYVIGSATALDWNVLDLFYQLTKGEYFVDKFKRVEDGDNPKYDEGPVWNLSIFAKYLAKFKDHYFDIINASRLKRDANNNSALQNSLFNSFFYSLYKRQESEFENEEDPFPKGRVSFLTIHQSKGLEFPVVIVGDMKEGWTNPGRIQELMAAFIVEDEPLDRITEFDSMRRYYVALSRAEDLVILTHTSEDKKIFYPFENLLAKNRISPMTSFDPVIHYPKKQEKSKIHSDKIPSTYSFTSDYKFYEDCPRRYMVFNRYDFVPSRDQTRLFGVLVHQTIEDIHQIIIASRKAGKADDEIISKINQEQYLDLFFQKNYKSLKQDGGYSLDAGSFLSAKEQVEYYWKKLKHIALAVTDTEVRLNLPNIVHTDKANPEKTFRFNLEGVVDIVSENGREVMYDLKTHDDQTVRTYIGEYKKQLNIYAHIWSKLKGKLIDETAIIATKLPKLNNEIKRESAEEREFRLLNNWNPVVPLDYSESEVIDTLHDFGNTISKIEAKKFKPQDLAHLDTFTPGTKKKFANQVCSECDARFSCTTHHGWEAKNARNDKAKLKENIKKPYTAETNHETKMARIQVGEQLSLFG
ncbi:MAG: ATP-dependent helicase [Leptospiraceae bacterium]|nr:ATP-dependent helicase [Leptospiraceae bacterium]